MADTAQDAAGAAEEIKTMKLYSDIERIDNELRELGVADGAPIDPPQLFALDSLHYEGTEACDAAIAALNLGAFGSTLFTMSSSSMNGSHDTIFFLATYGLFG